MAKRLLLGGPLFLLILGIASPVIAGNPPASKLEILCNGIACPGSVGVNAVVVIGLCMDGGAIGTVALHDSGLGTSGLGVTSPGLGSPPNPLTGTTWTFDAAAGKVLPACAGQPLPASCPGDTGVAPCTTGLFTAPFGDSSPGWTLLSGPSVGQTSEEGTYGIDVNFRQQGVTLDHSAFFDVTQHFSVPEFGAPVAVVTAVSLLGLVLLRKKYAIR